jgi:hypothetical protein
MRWPTSEPAKEVAAGIAIPRASTPNRPSVVISARPGVQPGLSRA